MVRVMWASSANSSNWSTATDLKFDVTRGSLEDEPLIFLKKAGHMMLKINFEEVCTLMSALYCFCCQGHLSPKAIKPMMQTPP